jgi:hypothetical protein
MNKRQWTKVVLTILKSDYEDQLIERNLRQRKENRNDSTNFDNRLGDGMVLLHVEG